MSSGTSTDITNDTQVSFEQNDLENAENKNELSLLEETTASVWYHITSTQETYSGTQIPKSFEVDVPKTSATPFGKMWTHGNATEHMHQAMISIKDSPRLKGSNPNLYSQFILYDYYKSLGKVVSKGVKYNSTVTEGHWEFAFAPARKGQKYPVVKHALFRGI